MAFDERMMCDAIESKTRQGMWLIYLYTFFAIASTLFELYGISYSLSTFTWRFASVLLFSFLALINVCVNGIKICKENLFFLPFLVSVIGSFFANMAIGSEGYELRLIRFMLLFIYAVFLSPRYFNADFAMKVYKWIVWIATIVLLLQVVMSNLWGIHISGHLNLPLRSSIYANTLSLSRFYSIFEEPGYYGIFVSSYLCIQLAEKKMHIPEFLFIALALLLSTSSSNIGILIFIIIYYILFMRNNKDFIKSILAKIGILLVGGISSYFFVLSKQFEFVSKRLDSGYSLEARTEGYADMETFFESTPLKILFGNGMESYPISGYATLIIVFGIVGALFYFFGIGCLLKKTNYIGRFILFTFMFSNIGNVEFLGNASSMLIVFPFVLWYCCHDSYKQKFIG